MSSPNEPVVITVPSERHRVEDELRRVMKQAQCQGVGAMLRAALTHVHFGAGLALFNARISIESNPYPLVPGTKSVPAPGGYELVRARAAVSVPHRETALPVNIEQQELISIHPEDLLERPLTFIQTIVRDRIASLILHEVDEGITVCGTRVWDPHRQQQDDPWKFLPLDPRR